MQRYTARPRRRSSARPTGLTERRRRTGATRRGLVRSQKDGRTERGEAALGKLRTARAHQKPGSVASTFGQPSVLLRRPLSIFAAATANAPMTTGLPIALTNQGFSSTVFFNTSGCSVRA